MGMSVNSENEVNWTYILCSVPCLNVSEEVVRSRGELQTELEAKQTIHMLHKVEQGTDLLCNL